MTDKRKLIDVLGIASIFQRHESQLKRFAYRFTSSAYDVDDICQEAIMRALEAERKKTILEPRAFLYGIIRNIVRKRLEQESRSIIDFIADFSPDEYLHNGPSVENHIDDKARMIFFSEAVSTLPAQCQRVFVLKKVYGYSHKEIAEKLDISISTVEKHVAAGLKRCLKYMRGHSQADTSDISYRQDKTHAIAQKK